jgi:hypothetical protein
MRNKIAIALLLLLPCACHSATLSKTVVIKAESQEGEQQLWLRGVKSPGARGIRVFLNPSPSDPDPEDKSRIGTVYFSHSVTNAGETFVLPLPSRVDGEARIVIVPIPDKQDSAKGPVELESAEITTGARAPK